MRKLVGIAALVGGILLIVTPRFILPACEYEGFARMHCTDSAHAEMVTGAVLLALGIAAMLFKSAAVTPAAAAGALALSIVSYVIPDKFGYCMSSHMPCNYGMVPAVRFIAVIVGLLMAVALVMIIVKGSRKKGSA